MNMYLFKLIAEHYFLAFIILNIILIDLVQVILMKRRGFSYIVTLAGYYGDRVLVVMILIVSSVLFKRGIEFESSVLTQILIVCVLYVISVIVAQKYLPPRSIEDKYHNFIALPIFAMILITGTFKVLLYANAVEYSEMLIFFGIWLVLLVIDIKKGRLNQIKFMAKHGLKA